MFDQQRQQEPTDMEREQRDAAEYRMRREIQQWGYLASNRWATQKEQPLPEPDADLFEKDPYLANTLAPIMIEADNPWVQPITSVTQQIKVRPGTRISQAATWLLLDTPESLMELQQYVVHSRTHSPKFKALIDAVFNRAVQEIYQLRDALDKERSDDA